MTRDNIIKMALEAGFDPHDMSADFTCNLRDIERFAALVAAAEREACAKVCEDVDANPHVVLHHAIICAATIRARSRE